MSSAGHYADFTDHKMHQIEHCDSQQRFTKQQVLDKIRDLRDSCEDITTIGLLDRAYDIIESTK